jgi:hypothetical protein
MPKLYHCSAHLESALEYIAVIMIGKSFGEFGTIENDHGRVRHPKQDEDHRSGGPVA